MTRKTATRRSPSDAFGIDKRGLRSVASRRGVRAATSTCYLSYGSGLSCGRMFWSNIDGLKTALESCRSTARRAGNGCVSPAALENGGRSKASEPSVRPRRQSPRPPLQCLVGASVVLIAARFSLSHRGPSVAGQDDSSRSLSEPSSHAQPSVPPAARLDFGLMQGARRP